MRFCLLSSASELDSNLAAFLATIVFIVAVLAVVAVVGMFLPNSKSTKLALRSLASCFRSFLDLLRF